MTAFGGTSRDPDEVMAGIDRWAAGFSEKAQRYQAAQQQTEQLRLTASSANGVVRVTVAADGNITELELSEKIQSMPPRELATQILDTIRRAQSGIAERVSEVMTEQLGDEDMQTRAVLLDNLRARFPSQDGEEDPPSRRRDGGRGTDDDDEYNAPW